MENWSKKIKHKMIDKDVKQSELAKQLNVSEQYISMVLNGKRTTPNLSYEEFDRAIDEIVAAR